MEKIILNTLYVILAYVGALVLLFFLFFNATKLWGKIKRLKIQFLSKQPVK